MAVPHPFPPRIDPECFLFYLQKDIFSLLGYFILSPRGLETKPKVYLVEKPFRDMFCLTTHPVPNLFIGVTEQYHVEIFTFFNETYEQLFEWPLPPGCTTINSDWLTRVLVLCSNCIEMRSLAGEMLEVWSCDPNPLHIFASFDEFYIQYDDHIVSSAGRTFKVNSDFAVDVSIENKFRVTTFKHNRVKVYTGWNLDTLIKVFDHVYDYSCIKCTLILNRVSGHHLKHVRDGNIYIDDTLVCAADQDVRCFLCSGNVFVVKKI